MLTPTRRSLMAILMTLAILVSTSPLSASARLRRTTPLPQGGDKKSKDKKKEDSDGSKDDKPKLSKSERKYQEIKRFSYDLYQKDVEFRDTVDEAYRRKQREHTEFAYTINMRPAHEQISQEGDKIKVYDTLYDNPLAQDYVNRVGQSLVPTNTTHLYGFKITLNPIPESRALSTGTVYISTGLLSMVDNEAQLAYILGHEIAHVEKDHWFDDVLVSQGIDQYNEKQAKKRAMIGAVLSVATAGMAGAAGSGSDALNIGLYTLTMAPSLLKFVVPNATVSWDKLQEDEADQLGMKYMLDRNYDPREVPKFYASLQRSSQHDKRVGLGFMGDPTRVNERVQQVSAVLGGYGSLKSNLIVGAVDLAAQKQQQQQAAPPAKDQPDTGKTLNPERDTAGRATAAQKMLGGQLSADLQAKLDSGELVGTTAEFEAVMAELKRDNGIRAYYYDMFQMARSNLEESLQIRSNDPYAHFFYGKVLKLTARNPGEKSLALAEFSRAISLDARRVLPESRLHRALAMIENKDPQQMKDIVATLKDYVSIYQREHSGSLPPNMDVIYDYMQEAGETNWSAIPAINVSTKNIDPIGIMQGTAPRPATASSEQPAPQNSAPTQRRRP